MNSFPHRITYLTTDAAADEHLPWEIVLCLYLLFKQIASISLLVVLLGEGRMDKIVYEVIRGQRKRLMNPFYLAGRKPIVSTGCAVSYAEQFFAGLKSLCTTMHTKRLLSMPLRNEFQPGTNFWQKHCPLTRRDRSK